MGQKVNPIGYRTGIYKPWKSVWFSRKKGYAQNALEDKKIRDYLKERLKNAGLEKVIIERSIADIKITVYVSRPGIVIGRGGSGIALLREDLKQKTASKVTFDVEEIKDFDTSASLIANNIASQIERRIYYKRAVKMAVQKAMDRGAKGIKIQVSGLLSGASSISRKEKYSQGSVPTQTLRADIDYAAVQARPNYGSIGIKVWVYKGELGKTF